ncbi:Hcp family type VI secretion system effector [Cohnella silvisoli]|uniref:Type VI secretion system tube protein Hcp n=1 Tax=Cohnella silvisoli TaxID=2873699 RepID=A0ABV1KMX4_9BACL|nr:type VI secretion system tube protein Hcp [Cohnella silvisoli]MCD9020254.1 type VI secretion system tube protein Hcp [Cohnella silvisoli]
MHALRKKLILVICLLMMVTSAASATAALPDLDTKPALTYNVYLKLDGITGDSTVRNYENWIVLSGVQFDVTNSTPNAGASGGGAVGGKAVLNNFTVTKKTDSSSIPLFLATVSGTSIKRGQFVFVPNGESAAPFLTIDLTAVNVTGYDFNNVYETIQLKFDSIKMSYSPTNLNGGKNPPISGSWSFFQNKKL